MPEIQQNLNNNDFSQTDTIHFSCEQCGKCCSKAPSMSFYDMLELSEEFIFQTSHQSVISYSKTPLDKHLLMHYQALGHTIMLPEIEASLFYYLDFSPIDYPSYKNCSKLIDNKCSIYGKRPTPCKLSPLNSRFDDTQQWRNLQFFKDKTKKEQWLCNFSNSSPVVFSQEQLYRLEDNRLYFQDVDNIRSFTDIYIEFLKLNEKHIDNHFKSVFSFLMKNQLMISDLIIPLQVARYNNLISEDYALNFIENQIALIDKEMEAALKFKRKEDRKTSKLYKLQKDEYLKALKNNLFKTNNYDINII